MKDRFEYVHGLAEDLGPDHLAVVDNLTGVTYVGQLDGGTGFLAQDVAAQLGAGVLDCVEESV